MADDQSNIANIPVLYSNNIRLGINFSDFRLFIGEVLPASSPSPSQVGVFTGGGVQVVDRLCVVLSPDLIPQVIDGLNKALKVYESSFGPLRKLPQGQPDIATTQEAQK